MPKQTGTLINFYRVALYQALLHHPEGIRVPKQQLLEAFFSNASDYGALFGYRDEYTGKLQIWLQYEDQYGLPFCPGLYFEQSKYAEKVNVYQKHKKLFSCLNKDCTELSNFLYRIVDNLNIHRRNYEEAN